MTCAVTFPTPSTDPVRQTGLVQMPRFQIARLDRHNLGARERGRIIDAQGHRRDFGGDGRPRHDSRSRRQHGDSQGHPTGESATTYCLSAMRRRRAARDRGGRAPPDGRRGRHRVSRSCPSFTLPDGARSGSHAMSSDHSEVRGEEDGWTASKPRKTPGNTVPPDSSSSLRWGRRRRRKPARRRPPPVQQPGDRVVL